MATIRKTVKIPASRRLRLDLDLSPPGRSLSDELRYKIILDFPTPDEIRAKNKAAWEKLRELTRDSTLALLPERSLPATTMNLANSKGRYRFLFSGYVPESRFSFSSVRQQRTGGVFASQKPQGHNPVGRRIMVRPRTPLCCESPDCSVAGVAFISKKAHPTPQRPAAWTPL
ncbi:MAG: hypothetical protein LBH35_03760 [Treponema sp.]|jgi:hypothetical protein|nr:hypothetical protein [Treponema sp.]